MYHDFADREIEDLEMDNMRRDAREHTNTLALDEITVEWADGTLILTTPDNECTLDASQAMQLLDYLYQHRNAMFRKAHALSEPELPDWLYTGPVCS